MNGWIKLTDEDGDALYVNVSRIRNYGGCEIGPNKSFVTYTEDDFERFRETPEEIAALIEAASEPPPVRGHYDDRMREAFMAELERPWAEKVAAKQKTINTLFDEVTKLFMDGLKLEAERDAARAMVARLADALESSDDSDAGSDSPYLRSGVNADLIAEARAMLE